MHPPAASPLTTRPCMRHSLATTTATTSGRRPRASPHPPNPQASTNQTGTCWEGHFRWTR
eukprot:1617689-Pyramimonas_sp.AAC.1